MGGQGQWHLRPARAGRGPARRRRDDHDGQPAGRGADAGGHRRAGELTLAVTGGPETLNAEANGAGLVITGNIAPVAALKFEVGPSVKSDRDLAGKKLGVTRLGSTTHSNTRALLAHIGLNPDKGVTYVQLNDSPTEAAALIAGQIDGALLAPPESTKVESQAFG
jgi:ABC-type nitrate/sulfonate/bicarbonate transport system substrate-binding protein